MITKIRKWLYKLHYAKIYEKEAWTHQLDIGLIRDQLDADMKVYESSQKALEEKTTLVEKLQVDVKAMEGDAYNSTIEEIKTIYEEMKSIRERNEDFQKKLLPNARMQMINKQQQSNHALYKAGAIKKIKY